jgi:hypothetical protein
MTKTYVILIALGISYCIFMQLVGISFFILALVQIFKGV